MFHDDVQYVLGSVMRPTLRSDLEAVGSSILFHKTDSFLVHRGNLFRSIFGGITSSTFGPRGTTPLNSFSNSTSDMNMEENVRWLENEHSFNNTAIQ